MSAASVTDTDYVLRLLLATACGLVIGLERQYRSRTAGLRTNALVATGACAFVLFGEQAYSTEAPLQIAAYVVSGVGFLGGGVILRQGFSVQGLNTAATLWCSAAVGCQAAAGHTVPALATTALIVVVHVVLRPLGRLVDRAPASQDEAVAGYAVEVQVRRKHETHVRALLVQGLSEPSIMLQGLASAQSGPEDAADKSVSLRADVLVEGNAATALDALTSRLSLEPGVQSVAWQSQGSEDEDVPDVLTSSRRWRWHRHVD